MRPLVLLFACLVATDPESLATYNFIQEEAPTAMMRRDRVIKQMCLLNFRSIV